MELISVQLILLRENIYCLCESLWDPQAIFYMNQGGVRMKGHVILPGGHQAIILAWASAVLSVETPGSSGKSILKWEVTLLGAAEGMWLLGDSSFLCFR